MKLKYTFEMMNLSDEFVMVPVGENADKVHGVIKLNEAGKEIVEMLRNETTVDKMVQLLAEKYDNDREVLKNYVLQVIDELRNAGLLEE